MLNSIRFICCSILILTACAPALSSPAVPDDDASPEASPALSATLPAGEPTLTPPQETATDLARAAMSASSSTSTLESSSAETLPLTTIAQQAPLGDLPAEPLYTVVSQPEEWRELQAVLPAPAVEAGLQASQSADRLLVVAFAGMRPSSGYQITIEAVRWQNDHLAITISQTTPGADDIVEPATTLPYHLVTLPTEISAGTDLSYVFYGEEGTILAQKNVEK